MCDGCGSGDCTGGGFIGGAGGPAYNNGFNTIGVGDVVSPGHGFIYGSGDLFYNKKKKRNDIKNIATKKPASGFGDFVSKNPGGGFGQGDLPLIVPVKPSKK